MAGKGSKASDLFANLRIIRDGALFVIMRGEKPLLTPKGKAYALPTKALAEAIADEWREQKEKIVLQTMPLTQLAATAIDLVSADRERTLRKMLAYSASDLLCHRADQPLSLAEKQDEIWNPLLEWCAARFGALLCVVKGIMPISQAAETIKSLHDAIDSYDDFVLAGLSHAIEVTGSLVLGLALAEKERNAEEIFQAAELDAQFQAMTWGVDPVASARFDSIRRDLENCERWFSLLRS